MPRALVVDDSRATRSALRRILQSVGYDVVEAEHGEHALEVMHPDDTIELVLVDWNMPVMDGFSLIKAIRKERKWAMLPIMMVSAEVDQRQIARAVMAGADEYVMKPFDSQTLLGKLGVARHRHPAGSGRQRMNSPAPIRVLVVEDSSTVRKVVSDALNSDREITVVGTAANGRLGLEELLKVDPDLVTLDIEMPEMDGLTMLSELRKTHPRFPVIMVSTLTGRGASATLDALSRGASDYVTKPSSATNTSATSAIEHFRRELIPRVKALCPRRAAPVAPARPARALNIGRSCRNLAMAPIAAGISPAGPRQLVGSPAGAVVAVASTVAARSVRSARHRLFDRWSQRARSRAFGRFRLTSRSR